MVRIQCFQTWLQSLVWDLRSHIKPLLAADRKKKETKPKQTRIKSACNLEVPVLKIQLKEVISEGTLMHI